MKSEYDLSPSAAGGSHHAGPEPLIGVGSWPGAVTAYWIGGAEQQPELAVTVSARPEQELSVPPATPAEQAARYRLICSQLDQPGLTVSLLSTLNPSLMMPVADGAASLRRYAAAAELVAAAAAAATPPDLSSLATLDELMSHYGMPARILATANADRPLNGLLAAGQPLAERTGRTEPDTVASDASTLAEVAARLGITSERLLEDNRGLRLAAEMSWVLPGVVALPGDAVLSSPLAVLTGDCPLTAAEVQAQHGCPPAAFAAVNAAALGVLQPGVQISAGATTVTTAQHDTLNAVLSRLAEAGVPLSAAELLAANGSTPLFRAGARVLLPPPPVTLSASGQLGTFAAPAFELAVALRLERPAAADSTEIPETAAGVEPDPVPARVERVDSVVPAPARDAAAFDAFVDACLVAVPGIRLATARPATARPATARPATARPAGEIDTLWAVAFGTQGISSVRLQPPGGYAGARFLAPRPHYPDPLHFDASIRELTNLGTLGQPMRRTFHDVDVERWACHFLTDLDRYLDEPFATLLSDQAPDALLTVRHDLAGAIAAGAAVVLAPDLPDLPDPTRAAGADEPAEAAGLSHARAALAASCRDSSTGGYGSVVVQHSVAAVTRFGQDPAPAAQLGGVVRASGLHLPSTTDLGQRDGWSAFTLNPSQQDTSQQDAFQQDTSRHGGPTSVTLDCDHVFDSLSIGSGAAADGDRIELLFVRPLTGRYLPEDVHADFDAIELPLAQRLRPALPTLHEVSARPSWTGSGQPTLSQVAAWTLAVSYSHEHAAHDEVRLSIWHPALLDTASADATRSGTPPQAAAHQVPAPQAASSPSSALASALAGYLAAADQLAALLAWDTKPPKGTAAAAVRQVRANAMATLAQLAGAVAEAWAGHNETRSTASVSTDDPSPAGSDGEECHEYRLRAGYRWNAEGERQLERLVVTMDRVAAGQPGGDWPVISWEGVDKQEPLTPGPVLDGQRSYTPARPVTASQPLTFRLEWPGLSVPNQQTARAAITVTRNPVLRAGVRTCPEFVLNLPTHTSNRASPDNTWTQEIALSGASLAQALQNCFHTLFGARPGDGRLSVEIQYSYLLGGLDPDGPELRAELPVAFTPESLLNPELADSLARTVEDWRRHVEPPASGAEWHVRLALLSPRAGEPPLLTLNRLVFAVSAAPKQP